MNSWIKFIVILFSIFASEELTALNASDVFTIVINNICVVRTTAVSTIALNLTTSTPGTALAAATNASTYLQLTSIAPAGETRKVMAIISTGKVPTGTYLQLAPSACITGAGNHGTPSTIILNKTSSQTIINGIQSGYTGMTSTSGFKLTYTWQPDIANYSLINATTSATAITITFTIATSI